MRSIFDLFLFLSEILLWYGVGRLAYLLSGMQNFSSIIIGMIATGILLIFWFFFFSPKADYRLLKLPRTLLIATLSVLTGIGLYQQGKVKLGLIILIGTTIIQIVGQYFLSES